MAYNRTVLNNSCEYIILNKSGLCIVTKKKYYSINVGLLKLGSKKLVYNFFSLKELKNILPKEIISNRRTIDIEENNKLYHLINPNFCIFFDVVSFFLFIKGYIKINKNIKAMGLIYNNKLLIRNKNDSRELAVSLSRTIDFETYNLLYKLYKEGGNIKIYASTQFMKNSITKINKYKNKILKININKGIVFEISKTINTKLINNGKRERITNKLPEIFKNDEYLFKDKFKVKYSVGYNEVINKLQKYKTNALKYDLGIAFGSTYCETDFDRLFYLEKNQGASGFDLKNIKLAKIKSIAEGIERFSSGFFISDKKDKKELKKFDINIIEKILGIKIKKEDYSKEYWIKKIYRIYSKNKDILIKKKGIDIPYNIVHYPAEFNSKNFYRCNSNGIGAGRCYEEALIGGLLELSERDSVMLTWLLKLTPNLLKIDTLTLNLQKIVKNIEKNSKGSCFIFDISYDKPFFHIMVITKYKLEGIDRINIGASSGLSLNDTIQKALNENIVGLFYVKKNEKVCNSFEDIIKVSDHLEYYSNDRIKYLDFLFYNNNNVSYNELIKKEIKKEDRSIGLILSLLENSVGGNFYVSELTTKYSQKKGIYILKVLSDNLIPIWFGHNAILPKFKNRLINKTNFQRRIINKYKYKIPDFLHFFD